MTGKATVARGTGRLVSRAMLALILVGGSLLSLAAFWAAAEADFQRVRGGLEIVAEGRAGRVRDKLNDAAMSIEATADFIPSQLTLDPYEFWRFTVMARRADPVVRLAWAPLQGGRMPIEMESRFDGLPPQPGNDLLVTPVAAGLVAEARDSGVPAAALNGSSYLMVWPVYGHDLPPADPEERHDSFSGVVVGEMPFDEMIRFVFRGSPTLLATIRIYVEHPDGTPFGAPALLVRPGKGEVESSADPLPPADPAGLRLYRSFEQFGRHWTLVSDFAPSVVTSRFSHDRWAYLALGLLATIGIALYLRIEQHGRHRAESDAAARRVDLSATETLLGAIVSSSDDAMISKTLDGIVTTWNQGAERIFGYSAEEMIGLPVGVLAVPGREDDMRQVLEKIRQGERVDHYETQRRCKDGRVLDISLSVSPICDAGGRIVGASKIARDITGAKAAELHRQQLSAQLHQAQKMEAMGELTGGIAHDFNNLLSVILGNLDFLSDHAEPGSNDERFIQAAFDATIRGAELIRRLLAFARRQPLAPRLTQLAATLEGMGELLHRTLGEDILLKVTPAEDLWPVMVDAAQLESSLLNLALNARHAMREGGTLTIEAKNLTLDEAAIEINPEALPGDYLVLSVADTGTGMSPEILSRVFEPFFTTKGNAGSGLGLSMVHGFVKQSGGYTRIYSEVGRGTMVRLYLPRAEGDAREDALAEHSSSAVGGHEVVLVVEDDAEVREVTLRRLHELGYRTIAARDGVEGLSIVQGGVPFDLLFTDMVMPGGMSGSDLADAARRLRPGLKVLFTSGFTAAAASAAMREKFGSNLLTKPYRKAELALRVRAALDNSA